MSNTGPSIQNLHSNQQQTAFAPTNSSYQLPPPKVTSCALESRNGSAGVPLSHAPFVAHFPTVFPTDNDDEAQPAVSAASPPLGQAGIFSKKDDPFNEDFFNMLNSSAGPDAPSQQQQIDSFWCR